MDWFMKNCIRNNNELQKSLHVPIDEEESRRMCIGMLLLFSNL